MPSNSAHTPKNPEKRTSKNKKKKSKNTNEDGTLIEGDVPKTKKKSKSKLRAEGLRSVAETTEKPPKKSAREAMKPPGQHSSRHKAEPMEKSALPPPATMTTTNNMTTSTGMNVSVPPPLPTQSQSPASPMNDVTVGGKDDKDKPLEKWEAEESGRNFIAQIDVPTARLEFAQLVASCPVDESKCTIWRTNRYKNQPNSYPCYDHNLVKNPNAPNDYTNASLVQVPHMAKPVLMGQFPRRDIPGALEEFWNTIFHNNVTLLIILSADEDVVDYFPQVVGSYENYGAMFVNNRKMEQLPNGGAKFVIEVLPSGMSNSVLTQVMLHFKWPPGSVFSMYSKITKVVLDLMQHSQSLAVAPDDRAMVVSKHGAGRAGYVVSLASIYCCLESKQVPKILEIVKKIREQRPYSVETEKQYISLYLNSIYIIKRKIGDPTLNEKAKAVADALLKEKEMQNQSA